MALTVMHMTEEAMTSTPEVMFPFGGDDNRLAIARRMLDAGQYTEVARIDGDDLNVAYSLTQNGGASDSWALEPPAGVHPMVRPIVVGNRILGHRSTMMGDIVKDSEGRCHLVVTIGFLEIPAEPTMVPAPT